MKIGLRTLSIIRSALVVAAVIAPTSGSGAEFELFGPHEPLALELVVDLDALCRKDSDDGCPDTPGTLTYSAGDGRSQSIAIHVRARGNWRRARKNCKVPPLFLLFAESAVAGTPFEGQSLLPLTTHCRPNPSSYEQYVLKEYIGYRLYNVLSESSLRVRLAQVTYRDSSHDSRPVTRYAFLTEHFDALADRHGAAVWRPEAVDPHTLDSMNFGILPVYQYMIGNTDWSMVYGHNVLAIRTDGGAVTTIPFDLDFSGLVNASYAGPPPKLPIRSVRQRIFRGFCRDDIDWDRVFAHFEERRAEVLELVGQVPGLRKNTRRKTQSYLEKFYATLDSRERRRKKIVDACRPLAAAVTQLASSAAE